MAKLINSGFTSAIRNHANTYSTTGSQLAFLTSGSSGAAAPVEHMRIDNQGYVGIGTPSPGAKLEIYGFSTGSGLKLNYGNSSGTVEVVNFIANGSANGVIGMQMVSAGVGDLWLGGSGGRSLTLYRDGNVGIGTITPGYKLEVNGSFAATTKSFVIDHPTKEGKKLQYGSLESPYHGVRLTGEGKIVNGECVVQLPDYIRGLVHGKDAQVQLTNYKHGKVLWVDNISVDENYFIVKMDININEAAEYKFFWSFTAVRKDIEDMEVEF